MKRLIVCADGTWNKPETEGNDGESTSTNVLKMLRAVGGVDERGVTQVRFYSKGVGTGNLQDKVLGGMFGVGLSENVLECYRFLANNYSPDDEIYVFGFSRGAFTARSLAGLIGAIGFIHPRRLGKLPEGWKYYATPPNKRGGAAATEALRLTGERRENVRMKCLGVWDTVGSLGIPIALLKNFRARKFRFHDVTLGTHVENAFHAIAVDEKRKAFSPTLWDEGKRAPDQVLEQVWFPGVHSNVGGGYSDQGLSDGALEWMIHMVKQHTELSFDDDYIRENIRPRVDGTLYNSAKRIWWWPRMKPRELPKQAELHASVEARRFSSVQPPYKPVNLG